MAEHGVEVDASNAGRQERLTGDHVAAKVGTSVAEKSERTEPPLHKRFRNAPLSGAVEGAYRSRTGGGFRNEPLEQAESAAT